MPEQDQLKPDSAHRGDKASLLRHALILQLKLLGDGLRDAMLVPVSITAALMGLLFRSKDPWLWYREVLLWGHASDQWIDLFDSNRDHADPDFNKLLQASRSRLEQAHNRNRQAEQTDDEPPAER
jgi:hypothetical protein